MAVVEEAKKNLIGWKLGRVITVRGRGFDSEGNPRYRRQAGGHHIAAKRGAAARGECKAGLKPARFQRKEIVVSEAEARQRYILARNPEEVARDRAKRETIIKELQEKLPKVKTHAKAVCELMDHPVYGRHLRLDSRGLPWINRAEIKKEEKLDGEYLLRTFDDTLSSEDMALGHT